MVCGVGGRQAALVDCLGPFAVSLQPWGKGQATQNTVHSAADEVAGAQGGHRVWP